MQRKSLGLITALTVMIGLGVVLLLSSPAPNGLGAQLGSGYVQSMPSHTGDTYLVVPSEDERPEFRSGAVRGTLADETGFPVYAVEVELLPLDKTGDQRWHASLTDWTDKEGKYEFPEVTPGEYVLAVMKHGAPDGRHPFVGTYYPGADQESTAEHIVVTDSSTIELQPLKLRRLMTVTVKINVQFEDGTHPRWSNLLFHNPSFPDQGVIGNEAPGVENGTGELVLPVGFEYYARAKVDCDTGPQIETRESRPVQQVRVDANHYPKELMFVIPGKQCTLWSPT